MSKKILITGGAGFIGHQVIKKILQNTDWELFVIDRLSYAGNLNRINDVVEEVGDGAKKRIEFIFHDLKASFETELLHKLNKIDQIVHIGASSHVTRSVQNPSEFVQDNVIGTFNLLEASRKFDSLELFYYFSTDEVFGPSDKEVKFKEWDRYNSKNPYSATKAAGEELTIAYANTYGIPSLISHCCNVYGERQHVEKFIPNTIRKIIRNEELIIHTDSNMIPGSRFYIHNEDLAESIVFLLKNKNTVINEAFKIQNKEPAKVNISGESLISNLEVAELISNELEAEFTYKLLDKDPQRPGHDIKYGLDDSFLRSIGGSFDREFKFGIKSTVKWFTDNKSWINL